MFYLKISPQSFRFAKGIGTRRLAFPDLNILKIEWMENKIYFSVFLRFHFVLILIFFFSFFAPQKTHVHQIHHRRDQIKINILLIAFKSKKAWSFGLKKYIY